MIPKPLQTNLDGDFELGISHVFIEVADGNTEHSVTQTLNVGGFRVEVDLGGGVKSGGIMKPK